MKQDTPSSETPVLQKGLLGTIAIFFFFSLVFSKGAMAVLTKVSPKDLFFQIFSTYDFIFLNAFPAGQVQGIPVNVFFFGLTLLNWLSASLAWTVISLFRGHGRPPMKTLFAALPINGLIAVMFVSGLQAVHHVHFFIQEKALFDGMTTDEKRVYVYGKPYEYARFCRERLPGKGQIKAEFISDMNIHQDPFMRYHRQLAYFLYPAVVIRGSYPLSDIDAQVIFYKNDPQSFVREGFVIKGRFNPRSLWAVRKPSSKK